MDYSGVIVKTMYTINRSPSECEKVIAPVHGRYFKGFHFFIGRHLIAAVLSVLLILFVLPLNVSAGPVKDKKTSCRARKTSYSYPVIISKKKSSTTFVHKRNPKKARKRIYSFPI